MFLPFSEPTITALLPGKKSKDVCISDLYPSTPSDSS